MSNCFAKTLWLGWVLLVVAAPAAWALPDLSEPQQQQLATAEDGTSEIDGPALYPLLENVSTWPAKDESGAQVPDWSALAADPAAHRGEIFLIEGQIAGPVKEIPTLRPGPWGDTIEQWTIKYGPGWDDVAVVYMADPAADVLPRTDVRVPARFYKVWRDTDQTGQPSDFLVFVGNAARLGRDATRGVDLGEGGGVSGPTLVIGATLILGGLAFSFFWRRLRSAGSRELRSARLTRARRGGVTDDAAEEQLDDHGQPLPPDPDAALEELARRRAKID